jgi:hypothetical protein
MKKFSLLFALCFFSLTSLVNAQDYKLKFHGFDDTFITLGEYETGFYTFSVLVDYAPFHFELKGKVNAGPNTLELPYLLEDIVVIVTYWAEGVVGKDGKERFFAFDSVHVLLDDEPCRVTDLSFALLPPHNSDSRARQVFSKSAQFRQEYDRLVVGEERADYEEEALIVASAVPWNKELKAMEAREEQEAINKRIQDSVARVERDKQRRADSLATIQKQKEMAAKRRADSIAYVQEQQRQAKMKKKVAVQTKEEAPQKKVMKRKVVKKPVEDDPMPTKRKVIKKRVVKKAVPAADPEQKKYQKYAYGLMAVGGVSAIYMIMEQQAMNKSLQNVQDWEALGYPNGNPADVNNQYHQAELDNKNKHESNRNLGAVLAALSFGASVVLLRF